MRSSIQISDLDGLRLLGLSGVLLPQKKKQNKILKKRFRVVLTPLQTLRKE
jgi:hypothetical protein